MTHPSVNEFPFIVVVSTGKGRIFKLSHYRTMRKQSSATGCLKEAGAASDSAVPASQPATEGTPAVDEAGGESGNGTGVTP